MSADKSKKKKPAGAENEDRNIVEAAESDLEGAIEQKALEYWAANKGLLMLLLVGLVGFVVAIQFFKYQRAGEVASMQAEYLAEGMELADFAESYSDEALGGLAFLTLADEQYEAGNYEEASDYYRQAQEAIKFGPVYGRAVLGEGVSLLNTERASGGVSVLESLMDDVEQLEVIRAEAAYHLAHQAYATGQSAVAREHLNALDEFEFSGIWSVKAANLRSFMDVAGDGAASSDSAVDEAS